MISGNAATFDAILLGSMLSSNGVIRGGEGTIRAGQDFKCRFIL